MQEDPYCLNKGRGDPFYYSFLILRTMRKEGVGECENAVNLGAKFTLPVFLSLSFILFWIVLYLTPQNKFLTKGFLFKTGFRSLSFLLTFSFLSLGFSFILETKKYTFKDANGFSFLEFKRVANCYTIQLAIFFSTSISWFPLS